MKIIFKKLKKPILIGLFIIFIIILALVVSFYFFKPGLVEQIENGFEIDTLFLKVALPENGTATNNIKIRDSIQDFSIKINQIPELVSFGEGSPKDIGDGEHNVEVIFDIKDNKPDIYLGELEISTKSSVKRIPIILEVQSKQVLFDSNINLYPQGQDIVSGQRLNVDIKIFDLFSVGRSNVQLTYFVKDFSDIVIISETESLVVDGKLDYSKSLDLPKNIKLGNYVLGTVLKYENSTGISSIFFNIVEETEEGTGDLSEKYIIIIVMIFVFFFLIFLALFIYSLFFRDKLLKELQNQYRKDLTKQRQLIRCKQKQAYSKLKTPSEKKEYKKQAGKVIKQRVKAISKIYYGKAREFRKIKKKYNGNEKVRKLIEWKRKGYDTSLLDKKYKLPDVRGVQAKVKQWKKKGYDTSVLERKKKK